MSATFSVVVHPVMTLVLLYREKHRRWWGQSGVFFWLIIILKFYHKSVRYIRYFTQTKSKWRLGGWWYFVFRKGCERSCKTFLRTFSLFSSSSYWIRLRSKHNSRCHYLGIDSCRFGTPKDRSRRKRSFFRWHGQLRFCHINCVFN